MKKGKIIVIVCILLAVAFTGKLLLNKKNGKNQNGYKTFAVERNTVFEKALAIGTITPVNEIQVKSKIAGIVKERYVEVGDVVTDGQVLVKITPDPTPQEITEARRNVQLRQLAFENAEKQFERQQELLAKNLISTREFEMEELNYREANLQKQLSEDRLSLLEKGSAGKASKLVESVVRSPISGVVLEKFINIGDPVVPLTSYQAGTPLFTLADMSELLFRGTIDEIDVGKVHVGHEATLQIGALPGKTIDGRILRISPKARIENNATIFDIEIEITNTHGIELRAGYSANADIILNKAPEVLTVPERVLIFRSDSVFVEVEDTATGAVLEKPVQLGLSDGINVEIASGIKESELIVERPPKEIK